MYKVGNKIKIKEQYIEYLCKYIKEKNLFYARDNMWSHIHHKKEDYKENYIDIVLSKKPLTIIIVYNQAVAVKEFSYPELPLPLEIIEPLKLTSWISQKGE